MTTLEELIKYRRKDLDVTKKLSYKDCVRLLNNLDGSPFEEGCCSIKQNKLLHGFFYFNRKKVSISRLLYMNYVGDISDNEYVYRICRHKADCLNIGHLKKIYRNNSNIKKPIIEEYKSNYVDNIILSFD